MDRNSLSKSSESNNTIDEPEFENVHSVAEHEAIELGGEAKAKSIVSKSTRMVKIDTCLLKPKANATKLTTEDIEERIKRFEWSEDERSDLCKRTCCSRRKTQVHDYRATKGEQSSPTTSTSTTKQHLSVLKKPS
uniref:Uncharacterized protein LOC111103221 n=1 Tax=Crassostrea virginica TaxID=6565 RepID=A0A8B8APD6_CRAVI|nr:uncharacterized protein LOC111103221 [Crassostrea virginica]